MNFMGMGAPELLVVGIIAFLLFGAKGMRDGVKSVGKVMRDLKGQSNEFRRIVQEAVDEAEAEVNSTTAVPPEGAVARPAGALATDLQTSGSSTLAVAPPKTGAAPLPSSGQVGPETVASATPLQAEDIKT